MKLNPNFVIIGLAALLINKFLQVFQQPATDESFPIKLREFLMVFLVIYFDFENIAL